MPLFPGDVSFGALFKEAGSSGGGGGGSYNAGGNTASYGKYVILCSVPQTTVYYYKNATHSVLVTTSLAYVPSIIFAHST